MNIQSVRLVVALAATLVPAAAIAQHEPHQGTAPQASAELVQCARVQPVVDNIIAAATTRLESARLSNNPADMRAAVDHLEGALRDIRAQLTPCSAPVAATDPHASHAMPSAQQPSPAAAQPSPAPAVAADPHAGHAMPAAATSGVPVSKPAATRPSSQSADPHAGHAMLGASLGAPAKTTPAKPSKAERPQAADAHAGHTKAQSSEKQMDPVNGLMVDPATAPKTTYQGQTYYFSSERSRKEFLENPAKFAKKPKG